MHLKTRNVNTAFHDLVFMFCQPNPPGMIELAYTGKNKYGNGPQLSMNGATIVKQSSRNGNVLRIDEPVTITYTHPRERVLFNAERDANPFSLLYEALWMLAGRNDVAPLAYYTKNFANFSDDDRTLNGAYGYRWRHAFDSQPGRYPEQTDQLDTIVQHLKADPTSRRAVLQMWNVEDDLLKVGGQPCGWCEDGGQGSCLNCGGTGKTKGSKDVCCNLSVMFSLREAYPGKAHDGHYYLDITVTNRSNDLVWGLLGADFMCFSILQEYMAARLGTEVGLYHHFTNNLHVYDWNWEPDKWSADRMPDFYVQEFPEQPGWKPEYTATWKPGNYVPLVRDPEVFERELPLFVETFSGDNPERKTWADYSEPFLADVAAPMMTAFSLHKRKNTLTPLMEAEHIKADDWRIACQGWLERRVK